MQFESNPPRFNIVISTFFNSAFLDTGIARSAVQEGHRMCSPARMRIRLLQLVFSGSQEKWGVASSFRSLRVEPLPRHIQVKNANNQNDCVSDPDPIGL